MCADQRFSFLRYFLMLQSVYFCSPYGNYPPAATTFSSPPRRESASAVCAEVSGVVLHRNYWSMHMNYIGSTYLLRSDTLTAPTAVTSTTLSLHATLPLYHFAFMSVCAYLSTSVTVPLPHCASVTLRLSLCLYITLSLSLCVYHSTSISIPVPLCQCV